MAFNRIKGHNPRNHQAAASPSRLPSGDCVVRALDRAGTAANKTVRPSAMVGCAKTASRSSVYGDFASMAVCTTDINSPASVPKAVSPRISSLSALMRALMNPRVSERVCARRTFAIGILARRYWIARCWACVSFRPTRANSGSVNKQNGTSRP